MILINEKISLRDIILKYVVRDFFLGMLDLVPSAVGVVLRLIFYRFFLKKCGKGFTLRDRTTILFPERISIGNNVGISHFCFIDGAGGIEIGDYTRIGAHSSIISSSHSFENPDMPIKLWQVPLA
ncbi:MAG: hypothetical protein PHC85_03285 [Candidatus Pacebacteria bacterium]|nr:hypothetical protein [Candidatus Paceibacterota bacterium]